MPNIFIIISEQTKKYAKNDKDPSIVIGMFVTFLLNDSTVKVNIGWQLVILNVRSDMDAWIFEA